MKYTPTAVAGVTIIDIEPHRDHRGFFSRSFCADEFLTYGLISEVAQTNLCFNYTRGTVREIAEAVSAEFPGCELTFGPPNADNRSYRVAFGKIREVFGDFRAAWDVAAGAAQLHRVFQAIAMDPETFHGRGHTRLKQIEYLLKTGQVDERLFWKETQ